MTGAGTGRVPDAAPNGDDIYALPVGENYLVYAPLRNVCALVNGSARRRLAQHLKGHPSSRSGQDALHALIQALDTPPLYPEPSATAFDPPFLGILPTRACNLACVYCHFGARYDSGARLDLRQATAAVDWMADQAYRLRRRHLNIHFFGGEPFVAGEVVDVVVHRARAMAAKHGLIPHFEAATNGVFGEARAQFVGDYFDTVVLSLDGFQRFHDCQRPMPDGRSSFEAVEKTALRLSQAPADLCLRICVTSENLSSLEDIVTWACTTFRPSIVNIETLKATPEAGDAGLYPPDPFEFAARCVRACRQIESHGVQAVYAAADISSVRETFCPVGRDTVILSPDGRLSSCYLLEAEWRAKGLDLNIGTQDQQGAIRIDPGVVADLRHLVTDKPRCRACFCRWTCAGGCHVSETYPGCDPHYSDFCIQTRLITLCFLLRQLGLLEEVDKLLSDPDAMHGLANRGEDTLAS